MNFSENSPWVQDVGVCVRRLCPVCEKFSGGGTGEPIVQVWKNSVTSGPQSGERQPEGENFELVRLSREGDPQEVHMFWSTGNMELCITHVRGHFHDCTAWTTSEHFNIHKGRGFRNKSSPLNKSILDLRVFCGVPWALRFSAWSGWVWEVSKSRSRPARGCWIGIALHWVHRTYELVVAKRRLFSSCRCRRLGNRLHKDASLAGQAKQQHSPLFQLSRFSQVLCQLIPVAQSVNWREPLAKLSSYLGHWSAS